MFCICSLGNLLRATTAGTFSTSQLPKVVWTWYVLYIWLGKVLRATTACTFSASQLPTVVRTCSAFTILTWKCASLHFFDFSTSKSGLNPSFFYTFDLEMCFAQQRRALFRHLNFQKWSEPGVLCTFWLRYVVRATTACNFSSLIWPAGSAPAALASLLFDPPEPQIVGKTQWIATFLPFREPASSFFSDLLTSFLLLSDSSHLCFSNCPYCRKFHFQTSFDKVM